MLYSSSFFLLFFTKFITTYGAVKRPNAADKPPNAAVKRPNACHNFLDYFEADTSKNCFYDPDMFLETPELIKKYAGKVETHTFTTEDGYILTMFRIPRDNAKDNILLQHPLGSNSRIWVGQGNESLGFYLWRNGYDIWLNNARGTLFSDKHVKLKTTHHRFWDYRHFEILRKCPLLRDATVHNMEPIKCYFSFHESGFYDIHSQIKYMKNVTERPKILYVGHSLGVTTGLIYASMRAEEAKNSVKAFVFMGSSAYFKYATTPLKLLVPYEQLLRVMNLAFNVLGLGNVVPAFVLQLTRVLFRAFPILLMVINTSLSFVSGWTPEQADPAIINFDASIHIKSLSMKTLAHYLQLLRTETVFEMYDYGKEKNLKLYNSTKPLPYPIENISVPILLVSSYNDTLTTLKDSDLLQSRIPTVYDHLKLSGLNHVDYFVGRDRRMYFDDVLNFLNKFSKT